MKNLKLLVHLVFVLFSISSYSQLEDPLSIQNEAIYNKKFIDKLGLEKLNFTKNEYKLHLYNKNTKLYDNYFNKEGNTYVYSNSNMNFTPKSNDLTNFFLRNNPTMEDNSFLQENPLLRKNYFQENSKYNQIRDSFNPHGASNIKEALLGGFLGLLFDE